MINIPQRERDELLETRFKFIFLRDPVERMLSAYSDKVGVSLLCSLFRCRNMLTRVG